MIYEYFSFLECGCTIYNFDYYKLAHEAKKACCKFGIKASQKFNSTNSPMPGVAWGKYGITKTMLHSCFDEIPNDISRFGQIRQYGTKTFEKLVKHIRQPVLKNGGLGTQFYSKSTKIWAENASLGKVIEFYM